MADKIFPLRLLRGRSWLGALFMSVTFLVMIVGSDPALASNTYPGDWATRYPSSQSDDNMVSATSSACQLCHQTSSGGNTWNLYGWAIKQRRDAGDTLDQALSNVEGDDSDGNGDSNLVEINANAQPGWVPGAVNTIYRNNGKIATTTESPPAGVINLDPGTGNNVPVAVADSYSVNEDDTLNVVAPGVLGNDTDADLDTLTAVLDTNVSNGPAITLNANGSFSYAPNGDFNGSDSFTYHANDTTDDSNIVTVSITVNAVNDVPSFSMGGNQTVNEDAGPQAVAGFATGMSPGGGADEAGQVLTFNVSTTNDPLFAVLPAIDATTGELTYTPAADANGSATINVTLSDNGGTANGGVDTSAAQNFTITVNAVNDAPSFTVGANQTVNEDAGPQAVAGFATGMSPGGGADEAGQVLTFNVSTTNDPLFAVLPAIDATTGELTYTPATATTGSATVQVTLSDNGGTANGGVDTSAAQNFTITVNSAGNNAPVAVADSYSVNEDDTLNVVAPGVLGNDTDADLDPLTAVLDTNVSNGPAITLNANGSFSYAPNGDFNGSDSFTYHANDTTDDSNIVTVSITVNAVNDVPSFSMGGNQTVNEDAGPQAVAGFATGMSPGGGADEAGQVLTFNVSTTNDPLFAVLPAIDATTGELTYTPAADANGSATINVTLSDNGGTANGGVDTSAAQNFTITVNAVNDAPSFTVGANQTVNEDAGPQAVAGFATGMSPGGGADEAGQVLTFNVSTTNDPLFAVLPAIDATTGELTYTPATATTGSATVQVTLSDNGGTANGGVDTSAAQNFTITVQPVPTLSTPILIGGLATVTSSTATLGATQTSNGGLPVTARGIVWNTTGAPTTADNTAELQTGADLANEAFSGLVGSPPPPLTAGTQVFFRGYATNSAGSGYTPTDATVYTEPANQPTGLSFSAVSATGITVSWSDPGTATGAEGAIVVMKAGSDPNLGDEVPVDGNDASSYSPSSAWGSAGAIGAGGAKVVFLGSGNSVTVGGLTGDTLYYVRIYEYAGSGTGDTGINYLEETPLAGSQQTVAVSNEPTIQVTNLNADQVASRAMRLSWTRGNGDGTIVTVRAQGTSAVPPVDFQDYTADPDYSLAPETSPGSGNYVVYKGAATLVNVSGLASSATYVITAYAWGGFTTETDYLWTNAPEITQPTDGPAMHNLDNAANCGDCHSNHSNSGLIPYGTAQEDVCRTCHQETGPASGKLEFALHLTPNYGDVDPDCGSCHEVHAHNATDTTLSTNPVTLQQANNIAFIRANVDKYITTATLDDAVYHVAGDDLAIEGGDASTSRGICQSCHTQTSYHTNDTALEASQCHRGGANDTCDASQVNCTSCHSHTGNFAPSGGSCTGCHNSAQNGGFPTGRRAIMGEFSLLSHHVSGTVSDADCEVCHAQSGAGLTTHTHMDGWLTLWNVDDHNADAIKLGDHANPFTDSTEAAKLTQFCLNCHDSNGAAAEASPLAPFTGSGAPPVIDSTHWSNSSHNTGGENGASPVTCFGDGQGGCHASGHGSEKQWLLAPYTVPATDPDRSEEREDFCFECHDSDGMSTINVFADFNGTLHQEESASGALINNRHDVLPTDQAYSGGLVTCKNCHDQHKANTSDTVVDPDDAAFLPNYSISSSYTEDGHNIAYNSGGNLDPTNPEGCADTPGCSATTEPDYIKFCLACHDGTTPPGVTMSANMINMADAYAGTGGETADQHGTDVGSTGSTTSKGGLKQPWVNDAANGTNSDPSAGYAAMNCSTCHGAHGTGSIFNLRESVTVAGVQMAVGGVGNLNESAYNGSTTYILPIIPGKGGTPDKQSDHYWGAWCTFCHKMDSHPGKVETDSCTNGHMHGGGAF